MLAELPTVDASSADEREAARVVEHAATDMGRTMETGDIRELLLGNLEHPRWEEVSDRCLTCGNCTLVCPTCFCHSVDDVTDLASGEAERTRRWDSCFNLEHSYIHGGSVRTSGRSRYRQWMTHKLATWIDQFGTSGCVGCGRCITWCPVAIDITEEAAAIRATDLGPAAAPSRASLARMAAASSVMSIATGHHVMQRPQPTQPELPNWSIHVASLCVIHCR